jgi:hypothetical protein
MSARLKLPESPQVTLRPARAGRQLRGRLDAQRAPRGIDNPALDVAVAATNGLRHARPGQHRKKVRP